MDSASQTSNLVLPIPAIVCIVIGGYILLICIVLCLRQFMMRRFGICGCSDFGKEGVLQCECCAQIAETCNCFHPLFFQNCINQCCPSRKRLDCGDIVTCQCCDELDGCCGSDEPLCDIKNCELETLYLLPWKLIYYTFRYFRLPFCYLSITPLALYLRVCCGLYGLKNFDLETNNEPEEISTISIQQDPITDVKTGSRGIRTFDDGDSDQQLCNNYCKRYERVYRDPQDCLCGLGCCFFICPNSHSNACHVHPDLALNPKCQSCDLNSLLTHPFLIIFLLPVLFLYPIYASIYNIMMYCKLEIIDDECREDGKCCFNCFTCYVAVWCPGLCARVKSAFIQCVESCSVCLLSVKNSLANACSSAQAAVNQLCCYVCAFFECSCRECCDDESYDACRNFCYSFKQLLECCGKVCLNCCHCRALCKNSCWSCTFCPENSSNENVSGQNYGGTYDSCDTRSPDLTALYNRRHIDSSINTVSQIVRSQPKATQSHSVGEININFNSNVDNSYGHFHGDSDSCFTVSSNQPPSGSSSGSSSIDNSDLTPTENSFEISPYYPMCLYSPSCYLRTKKDGPPFCCPLGDPFCYIVSDIYGVYTSKRNCDLCCQVLCCGDCRLGLCCCGRCADGTLCAECGWCAEGTQGRRRFNNLTSCRCCSNYPCVYLYWLIFGLANPVDLEVFELAHANFHYRFDSADDYHDYVRQNCINELHECFNCCGCRGEDFSLDRCNFTAYCSYFTAQLATGLFRLIYRPDTASSVSVLERFFGFIGACFQTILLRVCCIFCKCTRISNDKNQTQPSFDQNKDSSSKRWQCLCCSRYNISCEPVCCDCASCGSCCSKRCAQNCCPVTCCRGECADVAMTVNLGKKGTCCESICPSCV